MSQITKSQKRLAAAGEKTAFGASFVRMEPCKRSQHYRKGWKSNLSRSRRILDNAIVRQEASSRRAGALRQLPRVALRP